MSAADDDPLAQLTERLRDEDLAPGTLVGEYRVEHKLGEGGMARVFAAVHPVLGKRAAVKVISRRLCADLHALERFRDEARAVHTIGHPNIVDTFALGTLPDGRAYFLMEWLPGESLAQRLATGPLALVEALEILEQICDALAAAHAAGVVHRDLKPDNVFLVENSDGRASLATVGSPASLTPSGLATPETAARARPATRPARVKLLDFGIAKLAAADVTLPRTRSGAMVGTAGYMSPEQARGKPVDARTDLYALGAMTFEMVLGQLPFSGESAIDVLAEHLASPPPRPRSLWPDIPAALDAMILGLLEKSAADRPPLDDVRRTLATLRAQPLPLRRHRARRPWVLPAALLTLALSATAVLFVLLHPEPKPQPKPAPVPAPIVVPEARAPEPQPPALIVQTDAPDATILVDGHPIAAGTRAALDRPGDHDLLVRAPHRRPHSERVSVAAGQTVELHVALAPVAQKPAARPRTHGAQGDYTLDPFE